MIIPQLKLRLKRKFHGIRKTSKKGFSIVEMIIVISIMAIIAVIAVPKLAGLVNTSKISADVSTEESIEKSINLATVTGELAAGTVTATPNSKTGIITWTGADTKAVDTSSSVVTTMEKLLGTNVKFQKESATAVTWEISSSGNVVKK
jgi:prepilin-type N-terminal cleavage/methylation domain-containing protein